MPNNDDPSTKEPQTREAVKTIAELVLKDDRFRKSLGRRITSLIFIATVLAAVELTAGIPIINLTTIPLIAAVVVVILASIEDWIGSRRPQTAFYICPEDSKFIPIKRSSHPSHQFKNNQSGAKIGDG